MAMNANTLAAAILGPLRTLYRSDPPANQVRNEDYFLEQFCAILAAQIISHIQVNARCNGQDSDGDTHNNVQIV